MHEMSVEECQYRASEADARAKAEQLREAMNLTPEDVAKFTGAMIEVHREFSRSYAQLDDAFTQLKALKVYQEWIYLQRERGNG